MIDIIITIILIIVLGLSVGYLIRAKKKGVKCIGCPYNSSCTDKETCNKNDKASV